MRDEKKPQKQAATQVTPLFLKFDRASPKAWVARFLPGRSAGTLARGTDTGSATAPGLSSAWGRSHPPLGRVVPNVAAGLGADRDGCATAGERAAPAELMRLRAELADELERRATSSTSQDDEYRDATPAELSRLKSELAAELERRSCSH